MYIRKPNRLKNFDYTLNMAYFVTICTYRRQKLFGKIEDKKFSYYYKEVETLFDTCFKRLEELYEGSEIMVYSTMPDHIHFIVKKSGYDKTLSDMIRSFKLSFIKLYNDLVRDNKAVPYSNSIWQKSFFEHIINGDKEFEEIYNYIVCNPQEEWFKQYMKELNKDKNRKLNDKN